MATTDSSDRTPDGGYLAPLIPSAYYTDPQNEIARLGSLDPTFDGVRLTFDATLDAHDVRVATGSALDALGALLGVTRLAGELDDQYRTRIPATAQNGVAACTAPQMQAYLSAAIGLPVQCLDGTTPGTFVVYVLGTPAQPRNVMPLINAVKALGFIPSAFALEPNPNKHAPSGRLGTFRLGDGPIGGANFYRALH